MKVTLKDIALRTGYSINTVSHALAGKTDIAAVTREEICRVADEMGYIRNTAASGLRSGKSRTVALIENGSWAPMAAKVMNGLLQSCKDFTLLEPVVTVRSALNDESRQALAALAEALL